MFSFPKQAIVKSQSKQNVQRKSKSVEDHLRDITKNVNCCVHMLNLDLWLQPKTSCCCCCCFIPKFALKLIFSLQMESTRTKTTKIAVIDTKMTVCLHLIATTISNQWDLVTSCLDLSLPTSVNANKYQRRRVSY